MDTSASAHRTHPEQIRKSVTLTEHDLMNLDIIRNSPEALASIGAPPSVVEAALLRFLLTDAIGRARSVADDTGYAALAITYQHSTEENATRAAVRAQRHVREDVET